jgi:hypothetical protein
VLDTLQRNSGSISLIISGGAKGADSLAQEYANSHQIPTKIFLPDYKLFGRSAPLKRNVHIVEESDLVVAFWDGESRGTLHAINEAKRLGKEVMLTNF